MRVAPARIIRRTSSRLRMPPAALMPSALPTVARMSARVTVINLSNKYALYNFLSTFSGTHYVTPRTVTAELGFHF